MANGRARVAVHRGRAATIFGGVVILAAVAFGLGGCTVGPAQKMADQRRGEAEKHMQAASQPAPPVAQGALEITTDPWLGRGVVKLKRGRPLPITVEGLRGVAVRTAAPMPLTQIAELISAETGLPVRLSNMDLPSARRGNERNSGVSTMAVNYEGPASGLLDLVAGQFGVSWRFDGTSVVFFKYETRTFGMAALPGTQTVTDAMTGGQVGGGSGITSAGIATAASSTGGMSATQQGELKATVDFWPEFRKMVETLLAGEGAFEVSQSTGTVTVITTPDRMSAVARFIERENARLNRQVAITAEVWVVKYSDSDNYGLDLTSVFTQSRGLAITAGTPASGITGAGSLAVSVLNPPSWSKLAKWDGTEAAFKALSEVTRVGRLNRVTVTTLNSRPAMRKIAEDKDYLAAVSGGSVSNGVVTQAVLTPGIASAGIVAQFLPRVLDDGTIQLQYSLQLSGKPTFETATSGDQSIQLRDQANNIFVGQTALRSGATLVLGGYEQSSGEASGKGLGSPWNPFMGAINGSLSRDMIVVVITPVEISTDLMVEN